MLLLLLACNGGSAVGPLGIPLDQDGVTRAGVGVVDLTPVIRETYSDLDGDFFFDGCLDDPDATRPGCEEPFDDVDGDGWFDATYIGGFSPLRPALDVHDPVYARAVVIARDGEYVAFVALDLVGLGSPRIREAAARLAADGFEADRLVVASSHNHQGPDSMGLWGNPFMLSDPVSGLDPAYQERVALAIDGAVREAAAAMQPVQLRVGAVHTRDRGQAFNGARFGGRNPTDRVHGMIYDGRDPVVVSDQLLVLQGSGADGVVFTLTNWSGHPEVRGGDSASISSDWVGVTREVLEAHYGGVALHLPECLGGMQSALNGDLPQVLEDGTHTFQVCDAAAVADADDAGCFGHEVGATRTWDDGEPVPVWAERDSWDFVTSHGWHIAEAAIDALTAGEDIEADPIRVDWETFYVPVTNLAYQLLGPFGIFELGLEDAVFDTALCPLAGESDLGCLPTRTSRVRIGPIGWMGVPGELLPELAWGLPEDDPAWQAEVADLTARGLPGSRYFVQHPRACDGVSYDDCRQTDRIGDCDCLAMHAVPYRLSDQGSPPLLDDMGTRYRAVIGMNDNYLSYIIPEPDFNLAVNLLSDRDGDHYEDTVSPSYSFGTRLQEAQQRLGERW